MISITIRKLIVWSTVAAALICIGVAIGIYSGPLFLRSPSESNLPSHQYFYANFSGEYLDNYWNYNQPKIREYPDGISVSNSGKPAGVFFLYRLDKASRYRLKFSGMNRSNIASLRIQVDDGPLIYNRAPNGEQEFVYSNSERIELLIYSDTEFDYLIKKISLEECESCLIDDDLKRRILSEIPRLEKLLDENRKLAVMLLLDWCSNNSDFTFNNQIMQESSSKVFAQTVSQTYYELFEPDKGGVFCAGFAVFYMKVLELFDFDALTIDFGEVNDYLTHVTTIITFIENQVPKHYIFDPTFNITLKYKDNGEFADLKSIFGMFNSGRMNEVFWDEMPMDRDVIFFNSSFVRQSAKSDTCKKVECLSKKAYSCKYYNYALDDWIRRNKKKIEEHGFNANRNILIELMLHKVYNISRGESDPFVALLREQGVTFQ
jgi:hypothetical protein